MKLRNHAKNAYITIIADALRGKAYGSKSGVQARAATGSVKIAENGMSRKVAALLGNHAWERGYQSVV